YFLTRRPPTLSLFPYTTLFRSFFFCHLRVRTLRSTDWLCLGLFLRDALLEHLREIDRIDHQRREATIAGAVGNDLAGEREQDPRDRKSTRLNSSHVKISYAVFC